MRNTIVIIAIALTAVFVSSVAAQNSPKKDKWAWIKEAASQTKEAIAEKIEELKNSAKNATEEKKKEIEEELERLAIAKIDKATGGLYSYSLKFMESSLLVQIFGRDKASAAGIAFISLFLFWMIIGFKYGAWGWSPSAEGQIGTKDVAGTIACAAIGCAVARVIVFFWDCWYGSESLWKFGFLLALPLLANWKWFVSLAQSLRGGGEAIRDFLVSDIVPIAPAPVPIRGGVPPVAGMPPAGAVGVNAINPTATAGNATATATTFGTCPSPSCNAQAYRDGFCGVCGFTTRGPTPGGRIRIRRCY